ncbi:MAG: glutamate synthase large subunit [Cyclobacteriaceae bacterium]
MVSNSNKGLYDPQFEHDACGIGFIASLKNAKSHDIIEDALTMLTKMEHRGACGCESNSGDGAGILIQKPHDFLKEECAKLNITLPAFDEYGVAFVFFPKDAKKKKAAEQEIENALTKLGLPSLGYRPMPVDGKAADIGKTTQSTEPTIAQLFIQRPSGMDAEAFERKLYVFRNYTSHQVHQNIEGTEDDFYFTTCSYKTIVYKGQLTTYQVRPYYPDLQDERVTSALAVVHSRFSTNTFPKWKLAQPFRYIAHNGEINTVRGNVNWMKTREAIMSTDKFSKEELDMIMPICDHSQSDSANLDNAVELLVMSGYSLPQVMMMLIPEAWQSNPDMESHKRAFYEYFSHIMEPWDGPASISFTDGKIVGATLDRNGLRPSRYLITKDDKIIMASEAGVLETNPEEVVKRGRLQPGKIFVADLEAGKIISDDELKDDICNSEPYKEWLINGVRKLASFPEEKEVKDLDEETLLNRQQAFGYSSEDLKVVIAQLSEQGKEPLGSMGIDSPLPILSDHAQHISHYFKQLFAQVTNPPIDPIREKMVMSLYTNLGSSQNLLKVGEEHCQKIHLDTPIISNDELAKIKNLNEGAFKTKTLDILFPSKGNDGDLEKAVDNLRKEAIQASKDGFTILLLSDRGVDSKNAPIPALLATGAVHHALINEGLRGYTSIVVESGDIRETHHVATLIGYGAHGVNPYLAFESIKGLMKTKLIEDGHSYEELRANFIKGVSAGLLKIFSKMGISTIQSYHGAQIFEVLGLSDEVVHKCFAGTASRVGGLTFDGIAKEALTKHELAFPSANNKNNRLEVGGVYQWKRRGEYHLFNPESIHLLQQSTKTNNFQQYKKYARVINDQTKRAATLRGLLDFKKGNPIPLNEVEPAENILKRFATGAMSFGSISHEAHSTLAIAMNRIGAKSNSGEGGEDPARFKKKENGDWERSAIKQVASGRFGVTSYYLSNADELQIKMAQGAKPGEGGQLPGHKVDDWIGRTRHSTPGVGLISPPPHHDIYSIEDLAQLIFDLKNANREARINVKLVSEAGVGTIASGVVKAHADVVLIAGHDGGTGASPISSIRHAGLPWELGLSEAHQTLVRNKLRSRMVLQADGQMKTGRDLAIATLLGAEEWGVATAALVVEGCIMMRKCHLNTCPVGVATQNKELRKRFTGNADHVVNFFHFLVEDLREIMAELGFRSINEMVGQSQLLKKRENIDHWKYKDLDLSKILYKEEVGKDVGIFNSESQDHGIDEQLDWKLIEAAKPALGSKVPVQGSFKVVNTNRSVGTILSNEISKKYEGEGLPDDTITYNIKGSAGQSFGAFMAKGVTLKLEGEANDYFGKGLSGGKLVLQPHAGSPYVANENMIVGNVAFYGATSGTAYINGLAGERFCVRNSGVKTVVEGIGDHGCEYMTGGQVVVLGETGRNFAAGMSGGTAYIYDKNNTFMDKCNKEMVDFDPIDQEESANLKSTIEKHLKYTDSTVARNILTNWSEELQKFVKVMPVDYKRVLLERKLKALEEEKNAKEEKEAIHG